MSVVFGQSQNAATSKAGCCRQEMGRAYLRIMDVLRQLGQFNQNFLWASLVWGTVACGYIMYGRKQRSWIPFFGGFAMLGVSCFAPALTMSLVSIAIMFAVWWLMKQVD